MTDHSSLKGERAGRAPGWRPCDLCEVAFGGLIEEKLILAERLSQMTRNHEETLRQMAKFQSRALKAEAELAALQQGERS